MAPPVNRGPRSREYDHEPIPIDRKRKAELVKREFAKAESATDELKPQLPLTEVVRNSDDLSELKQLIRSSDWEIRDAAAEAIGRLPESEATKVLLNSLKIETDRDVLWGIILSLKNRLSESQLPMFLDLISHYRDSEIAFAAYQVAPSVEPEQYLSLLIQSVPDFDDPDDVRQVSEALSALDEEEFFDVIASQLEWADTSDRRNFLAQLGASRGKHLQERIQGLFCIRYFGECLNS